MRSLGAPLDHECFSMQTTRLSTWQRSAGSCSQSSSRSEESMPGVLSGVARRIVSGTYAIKEMITGLAEYVIFPLQLKVGLTKNRLEANLQSGDLCPVAAILDPEHYGVVIVPVSGLTQCLLTLAAAGSWAATIVRRTKRRDMPEPSRPHGRKLDSSGATSAKNGAVEARESSMPWTASHGDRPQQRHGLLPARRWVRCARGSGQTSASRPRGSLVFHSGVNLLLAQPLASRDGRLEILQLVQQPAARRRFTFGWRDRHGDAPSG